MEKKDVIEGNCVIAFFMGGKKSRIDNDTRYIRFPEPHAGTETYAFYKQNLKYHKSWDWLMPVVERIEGLGYDVFIGTNSCYLSKPNQQVVVHTNKFENKLQTVYEAIVSFVEWYNSLQKPKTK